MFDIVVIALFAKLANQIMEKRHYISSLPLNVDLFGMAVRGRWSLETMYWYFKVTFKKDADAKSFFFG